MKKLLYLIILFLVSSVSADCQCECTDCAVTVPNNGTASSFLDISGASNNTLGQSGQSLCMVCIELFYDAIEELDMILISPSGDQIDLMINTGLNSNDNITFEICFVPCSESADPDSGFPAVFDTNAGYLPNEVYTGSYYPASGCLEDFTGSVNGTWEMEMTDNVFLDNGQLLDWYLVFTDDSGLDCANADECGMMVSCLADGGTLGGSAFITECEGDPSLDLSIDPNWNGGSGPPPSEYDYAYVISDATTGIVEDINMEADLTSYPPGAYQICGLSYLIEDEDLLPTPDGSLEVDDIEDQIDDGDYCADLTAGCTIVVIEAEVDPPIISGPLEVCAGELVSWDIDNYVAPPLNYDVVITEGTWNALLFTNGMVSIVFNDGPGEFCVTRLSACGDEVTCFEVDVITTLPEFEIIGELDPCPGETIVYTVEPVPDVGNEYVYSATGGTIINETENTFTVEWVDMDFSGEICVELVGGTCDVDEICEDVNIEFDYEIPEDLDSPDALCIGDIGFSSIPSSGSIISYTWTSTNLSIISGLDTEEVEYEPVAFGPATICLEIETDCGIQGPVCDEIDIFEFPNPVIEEVAPGCEFEVTLEASSSFGNDIEWDLISGPSGVSFDPDDTNITTAEFTEAGLYEISFTEFNSACEETVVIEVMILNELVTTNPEFICDLDNNYSVQFEIISGQSPYTVNGNTITGNIFTSQLIESGEDFQFTIEDDLGCSTELEGDYECPCITEAGTMSNEDLFLCIDFDEEAIAEWNEDGVFDNNDGVIYILHTDDDDELGDIIATSLDGVFEYIPEIIPGVTYYISLVAGNEENGVIDFDDPCLSVAEGQEVTFYNLPFIDLEVAVDNCNNTAMISGDFDEDLLSIEWIQVSGPGTSQFSDDELIPTEITVSTTGVYSFEYQLSNNGCSISEEIEIEFAGPVSLSNVEETCNSSSDFYQVSIIVNGGVPPYTANIPGSFNGNIFTSDPIPTGDDYNIIITDDEACASSPVAGLKLCDCNTDAGSIDTTPLEVCGTEEMIQIELPDNYFLDDNDTFIFYIHTNNILNQSEIVGSSPDGSISFDGSQMSTNTVYYVSFVVGTNTANVPNWNDLCLDVSNSQPISWLGIPEANAGMDIMTCNDTIQLNASIATGFWTIIDQPSDSELVISDVSDPNTRITYDQPGIYTLSWTATDNGCESSDTINITRLEDPEIISIITTCNDDLISYTLDIELGSNAPYTIEMSEYTGTYSNPMVLSSDNYSLDITNALGCSTTINLSPIDCSCTSDLISSEGGSISLCQDELFNVSLLNANYTLAEEDTLVYLVHDGDYTTIGTILSIENSDFGYQNIYTPDQPYYVTLLISPIVNNNFTFDDPCSQLSETYELIWYNNNTVNLAEPASVCIGDNALVNVSVSHYVPVSITLESENGVTLDFLIENLQQVIELPVNSTIENWSLISVDGLCTESENLSFEVIGIEQEEPEFIDNYEICNNSLFGSTIELSELFVANILEGNWDVGILTNNNGQIDFDGLTPGNYNLRFSTEGFQDPCQGNTYNVDITVIECICPVLNLEDVSLCNNVNSFDLDQMNTMTFDGEWSLTDDNNIIQNVISDETVTVSNLAPGTYTLLYTVNDANFPVECNNVFSSNFMLEYQANAGDVNSFPSYCSDEPIELDLFSLLDNEDNNGQWSLEGIPVTNLINTGDYTPGLYEFLYTIDETTLCPSVNQDVSIEILESPVISVEAGDVLCFGDNNGEISIIIENNNGESYECYLNDILQTGSKTIEGLSPGEYYVYVSDGNCESQVQWVEISEPEPVSVTLGEDRMVEINEIITITALTNLLSSDIESVSWTDLSEIIGEDILQLRESFETNSTIAIEIEDTNGCIAFDEILITVIQQDLYIPNVFDINSFDNNEFGILNPQAVNRIYAFRIFDRWGNKVYEELELSPDEEEAFWDGYFNGKPAEQGVYVYVYDLELSSGERLIVSGDVTLLW